MRTHTGQAASVTYVLSQDEARDIAILPLPAELKTQFDRTPSLSLLMSLPEIGDPVYAVGAPKGLEFTFTAGHVSQIRKDVMSPATLIQTDVSLSAGSSGGPLVDGYGQVVGIATLASLAQHEAHDLNFAIASSAIGYVLNQRDRKLLTDLDGYKRFAMAEQRAAEEAKRQNLERKQRIARENSKAIQKLERERIQNKLREDAKYKTRALQKKGVELADEANRALRVKWRQLKFGMPATKVEQLLGQPTRVINYTAFRRVDWKYSKYGYVISDGEVSARKERLSSGSVEFDLNGYVKSWDEPNFYLRD